MTQRRAQVIVTRPEPDATLFADALKGAGFRPILSPVLNLAFGVKQPDFGGVSALAFTSMNGVRAYMRVDGPIGFSAFVVGTGTEIVAREAGFADVIPSSGDVEALAKTIVAHGRPPGTILHVSGRDQAGDLTAALAREGITARRVVLYAAESASELSREARRAIMAAKECWVALFSPRSAEIFLDLAAAAGLSDELPGISCACLSPAVAKAAGAAWRRQAVAREPTGRSLINAMIEAPDS